MLKLRRNKETDPDPDLEQEAPASNSQGITGSGNALQKIGVGAMAAALLAVALGFAYLLLLREPALQQQQMERVSSSYALQQAANLHQMFSNINGRVQSAARSPLSLSAIASKSKDDIALVESAMLDFFPEVLSLRIIPIGEMGTADFSNGNQGLRNHIEVDMVRRASEGESTEPQSYKFEKKWITSITAQVTHPHFLDRQAVVIITLDNQLIAEQLEPLDSSLGKFAVEQHYTSTSGAEKTDVIAVSGSGTSGTDTRYADIPGTSWRVSFSPSQALSGALKVSPLPLYLVLALMVATILGSVIYIIRRFAATLQSEIDRATSAADKKTPLELAVPELVSIAKQLRRATLRALRQSATDSATPPLYPVEETTESTSPADLNHPMFQSQDILDHDEGAADLGLDLAADSTTGGPGSQVDDAFPDHIFRAYDIRGQAQTELSDELISNIGQAVGSIAGDMGEQSLIVGCDGRNSSPRIKSTLIRALMETGRDVIDIGRVPTPLLYFATRHLDCRSGIMITGSHNPAEFNGMKIVLNQQTIAAGGIQQIRERALARDFATGNGRMTREDVVPAYQEEVLQDIAIAVPLKIVIDAGNGVTGEIAPHLFEELGCEVVELNCLVDGNFPAHPPDTSNEDNLAGLIAQVKEVNADFGVAFDGDGDRLAVVTSSGNIVRSDVLLMLFAQDVVSRNPGADVVFDVKCSRNLTSLITRHGGRPVLWKTGHAFMKEKMAETGALLGGEFSGHMFFGERWYGFDDGMYAAGRLAEILSTHGESLDDSIGKFPTTVNTPEIIVPVADDYKFKLIDKIVHNADFSNGKVNTMDGVRVDFSNGWGLIRASNTGPALTARFEADSQEDLTIIQEEFRAQIALIDPEVELTF